MMFFTAIVPIKAHSSRLPDKNFKTLVNKPLFEYVLDSLYAVDEIDEIIIDTDCEDKLNQYLSNKTNKFKVLNRPSHLLGDEVVMNELLMHSLDHTKNTHIIQTHVTNPLLKVKTIQLALSIYQQNLLKYDSLISVNTHKKRFYDHHAQPINHHLSQMLPTQQLDAVFEENSNLFIFSKQSFANNQNNRVGKCPYLFEMDQLESIDIDELHEFKLAEILIKNSNFSNN